MADKIVDKITDNDQKYYMNTFGNRTPVCFTHGEGLFLYGTDGKRYMDLIGGIAVNVLGHGHPELTESLCSQAGKLIHCSNLYYIESQTSLAEKLVNLCPGMGKVFFTNSGAESNEAAIKLARIYFHKKGEKRTDIITALNSFHGRTLAAVTATGQKKYNQPFEPLPPGFQHVPFNDEAAISERVNENTCAVMLEIIQGESGIIPATASYLKAVSKICMDKGALLIIDEVQTGTGRTGKFCAYESFGIFPDIVTMAKGLGGGVPIGAVLASDKVSCAFSPGDHGSTFGGNPLACSAALAVLRVLEKDKLIENASEAGYFFKEKLESIALDTGSIKEIRGTGLMIGIVLKEKNAKIIKNQLFDMGYLVNAIGDDVIRLLPPLIISEEQIELFCNDLKKLLFQNNCSERTLL